MPYNVSLIMFELIDFERRSAMIRLEGPDYTAEIDWDKEGNPVQYATERGNVKFVKDAVAVITAAVKMIDESSFRHVCAVYNVLGITHIPHLARFVGSGRIPSTTKTAHIIIASHNTTLQLVCALIAVSNNRRLRTMEVCKSEAEIAVAVQNWRNLPDRPRA